MGVPEVAPELEIYGDGIKPEHLVENVPARQIGISESGGGGGESSAEEEAEEGFAAGEENTDRKQTGG